MQAISTPNQDAIVESSPSVDLSEVPALEETLTEIKKRPRNKLKSNLVGQFVIIESGRYLGKLGYVTRGGNGYFAVNLLGGGQAHSVKKRSMELRVVDAPSEFKAADFIIQNNRPSKRRKTPSYKLEDQDEDFSTSYGSKRAQPRSHQATGVNWIDKQVILTNGKHRGELGTVTRSGHGFYAVYVPSRQIELMKRASELALYDADNAQDTHVQEIDIPFQSEKPKDLHSAANILMNMLSGREDLVSLHMEDREDIFLQEESQSDVDSETAAEDMPHAMLEDSGAEEHSEDEDSGFFFQEDPLYPPHAEYGLRSSFSSDLGETAKDSPPVHYSSSSSAPTAEHHYFSSPMYYAASNR